jgi:hypothetical protein
MFRLSVRLFRSLVAVLHLRVVVVRLLVVKKPRLAEALLVATMFLL